jgi:hypothetical protein
MTQAATVTKPFISGRAACRLGEMSRNELFKLAAIGEIETFATPGSCVKFKTADVERVRAERAAAK